MKNTKKSRSALLPTGIALGLSAGAFAFDAAGPQWMWQSEPGIGLLLAATGLTLMSIHVALRRRNTQN